MIPVLNPLLSNNTTAGSIISTAESETNWTGWGVDSGKFYLENEIYRAGSNSIGIAPKNTGDGGYGFDVGSGNEVDGTSELIGVWVWVGAPTLVNTDANYGVYIRIASGTSWTTNYNDYIVGGSNVAWTGAGWKLIIINPSAMTRDRGNGTEATINASIRRIGVGRTFTATSLKSTFLAVDQLITIKKMQVTTPSFTDATNGIDLNENGASADSIDRNDGGSWTTDGYEVGDYVKIDGATDTDDDVVFGPLTAVTASTLTGNAGELTTGQLAGTGITISGYCTLEDIYQKDGPTDDNWYGIVSKNRDNQYEINYDLVLGDISGALDSHFISRGDNIIFADQPVGTQDLAITAAEDTGTTRILFGNSTGIGNDRVGFAGSAIVGDITYFDLEGGYINLADASLVEIYGSTFNGVGGGVVLPSATGHYVTSTTFNNCGQVNPGQAQFRSDIFSGAENGSTSAALLWGSTSDVRLCTFLANDYAIEHTVTTTSTYYGNQFSGNDVDVNNTSGGSLTVNATAEGTVQSNPGSYTGTTTILNTKTLKITCRNESGAVIEGVNVRIETGPSEASPGTLISNGSTNSSGVYSDATYNYTVDVEVKAIARIKGKKFNSLISTITSSGLDVAFTMVKDPSVSLP